MIIFGNRHMTIFEERYKMDTTELKKRLMIECEDDPLLIAKYNRNFNTKYIHINTGRKRAFMECIDIINELNKIETKFDYYSQNVRKFAEFISLNIPENNFITKNLTKSELIAYWIEYLLKNKSDL